MEQTSASGTCTFWAARFRGTSKQVFQCRWIKALATSSLHWKEVAMFHRILMPTLCATLLAACSAAEQGAPDPAAAKPAVARAAPAPTKQLPPPAPVPKKLTPQGAHANLARQYDSDKDGRVSTQEALVQPFQRLMTFDSDNNRVLAAHEFHKSLGDATGRDKSIKALFHKLDLDKNGGLSEKEIVAYMWPGVVAADRNLDNQVDARDARPDTPKKTPTP